MAEIPYPCCSRSVSHGGAEHSRRALCMGKGECHYQHGDRPPTRSTSYRVDLSAVAITACGGSHHSGDNTALGRSEWYHDVDDSLARLTRHADRHLLSVP